MFDQSITGHFTFRAQELCEGRGERPGLPAPNSPYDLCGRQSNIKLQESRGGRPGLPASNSPYDLCGRQATLSFKNLEVDVLGSQVLIVLTVSVNIKQH